MKHLLGLFVVTFALVFGGLYWKNNHQSLNNQVVLRVFANSSFINQWGPGPWLKQKFEETCNCVVQFVDAVDTVSLIQRMKTEPKSQAADVVFGLDQFELELAQKGFEWKSVAIDTSQFAEEVKSASTHQPFVPYDFGVVSFVGRRTQVSPIPGSLDELLEPRFKDQISLPDPRTSSLGYQLLLWTIAAKGEDQGFAFLRKFNNQVKLFGQGWSVSYGLFQKGQVQLTLSYVTSPVYHVIEEKTQDYVAFEFREGHPLQIEFAGVPGSCRNCELAEKFLSLALSPEGQKIIMEKNFTFPVLSSVRANTPFAQIPKYKLLADFNVPNISERERLLKKWSQARRVD